MIDDNIYNNLNKKNILYLLFYKNKYYILWLKINNNNKNFLLGKNNIICFYH